MWPPAHGQRSALAAIVHASCGASSQPSTEPALPRAQIIVHVVEARDLKPTDEENMTADPVVVATLTFPSSVIPARQNTPRKTNTLNPVWDYTMIFRQSNILESEAQVAVLSLMVKDSNWTERDTAIGQFDFNLSKIYGRKNHEYFQQWCALMDPTGDSHEAQGYLRVNVTVLVNKARAAPHSSVRSLISARRYTSALFLNRTRWRRT